MADNDNSNKDTSNTTIETSAEDKDVYCGPECVRDRPESGGGGTGGGFPLAELHL